MQGTIRYLNPETREELYARIRRTVTEIAAASGATAEVTITENAMPVGEPACADGACARGGRRARSAKRCADRRSR